MDTVETNIAIIGAGFSGIATAIRLLQEGTEDFVILERADEIGGTWRDNIYPGVACDVASHLYSLSFAPNPDWSHHYAGGAEIQRYLLHLVERYELRRFMRFGAEVLSGRFDAQAGRWTLSCAGELVVDTRFLISGAGALKDPRIPPIPGAETFAGPAMHSARWDPTVALAGKRIGVIGTGASAIQLVPEVAKEAARLVVFQRTPPWVMSQRDRAFTAIERWLFRHVTPLRLLKRLSIYLRHEFAYPASFTADRWTGRVFRRLLINHIRRQVRDPDLARALTPAYRPGCKRILINNAYLPAMARDNVSLCTTPIAAVDETGVILEGGDHHELDVLIWCTGFTVDDPLGGLRLYGLEGRDLAQTWDGRPSAYLGLTMPGFPNAFMLLGPNTGLGHNSVVFMMEGQVEWILQALRHVSAAGPRAWLDCKPERLEQFLAELDRAHEGQVWATGCQSWYLNEAGENFTIWPGSTLSYRRRIRRFEPDDFVLGCT